MSEVTEEEFIDIGSRMAQELQEFVDDAVKASGDENALPGVRALIDEWNDVYKRSDLCLVNQLNDGSGCGVIAALEELG